MNWVAKVVNSPAAFCSTSVWPESCSHLTLFFPSQSSKFPLRNAAMNDINPVDTLCGVMVGCGVGVLVALGVGGAGGVSSPVLVGRPASKSKICCSADHCCASCGRVAVGGDVWIMGALTPVVFCAAGGVIWVISSVAVLRGGNVVPGASLMVPMGVCRRDSSVGSWPMTLAVTIWPVCVGMACAGWLVVGKGFFVAGWGIIGAVC